MEAETHVQERSPVGPGEAQARSADRVQVRLEARPEAAAAARNALRPLDQRLEPEIMGEVRLLISELVTNSVRHSGAPDGSFVDLEVALEDPATLRVAVEDRGAGFEPKPRFAGQSDASGWGIHLVDQLADRWAVERDNVTRVWFEIDLNQPRFASAA